MNKRSSVLKYFITLYNILYDLETEFDATVFNGELEKKIKRLFGNLNRQHRLIWKSILWKFPIEIALEPNSMISKKKANRYLKFLRMSIEKSFLNIVRRIDDYKEPTFLDGMPPAFSVDPTTLLKEFKYVKGENRTLIVVAHSWAPLHELYVLDIAKKVAEKTKSHLLYSKLSRLAVDYNKSISRFTPFRRLIDKLTISRKINCILDIHGYDQADLWDVRIGVRGGITAEKDVVTRLKMCFEENGLKTFLDTSKFYGGDIIDYHSYPPIVNGIQIELNSLTRKKDRKKIVKSLVEFISDSKC
ncbi:MAG: hypothetical protein ACP6IP_03905 [Candidatus Njordarchaeia archaeon]